MQELETEAIVCSLLVHGEHGAIVRMLTPGHGLVAAYVRGGRGRRMRPVLIPGNMVSVQLRSRTESQLPQATIELAHSRAPILGEPIPLAAVEWVTALVASALPERQPYPQIHEAMAGLLDAVEAAPSAIGWAGALAQFERLLASELGYGSGTGSQDEGRASNWPGILSALEASERPIFDDVLSGRTESLHDSRGRLIDRLKRIAG